MADVSTPYLVTGASGCIGAWVVKLLLERGDRPVSFDITDDARRVEQILPLDRWADVGREKGDITELDAVERALDRTGARHVIHLAGLQVPFCKSDPMAGAKVNVLGTVNVFEAAIRHGIERVAYASSAAVYGPEQDRVDEAAPCRPTTHYGVYKCANEGSARIYFQDDGLTTVGLRPLTVYGVGRDQGLTSDLTKAMKAAVVERPFTVRFSGSTDVIHARDVAAAFIEAADRAPSGAHVFNLHGASETIRTVVDMIHEHATKPVIQIEGDPLPIPPDIVADSIESVLPGLPRTPLAEGVAETMAQFRTLQSEGRLTTMELDA
jgi:nucleoside-diphosphate-sugar epimerase